MDDRVQWIELDEGAWWIKVRKNETFERACHFSISILFEKNVPNKSRIDLLPHPCIDYIYSRSDAHIANLTLAMRPLQAFPLRE